MRALWRLARRLQFRSRKANIADYTDLLKAGGLVCSFLWPAYGWFCLHVLGMAESMEARWLLMGTFIALWYLARKGPLSTPARWTWIATNAVGMVWLPWALYFRNERADYWQLSIVFFSLALGLCVRGLDMLVALGLGAGLVFLQYHGSFVVHDLVLIPVAGITMLGTYISVATLRAARRRIEEQSEEILKQNRRLLEIDRRKDEFTASIAHDLRTPLAVAMSLSEDLSETDLSHVARRRLDSLVQALRQMKRQSEDLLDLERFNLGVARIDPVALDMCSWLRRFEEGFTSMARARGLSFQIVLAQRQLVARFDPIRLETALFNLVSNAFKFTPTDGHVEVHLRRVGDRGVSIAVLDDGEGIPPEALPKIFDRYEQVDRGPGTYTAGVGIGLALVREIAEAHGGRAQVQSTLGLGNLFEIVLEDVVDDSIPLPMESIPPVRTGPLVAAYRPKPGSALALVVEDQQLLRHVLRDILERIARVATAHDGHEALRLIHELRPDVVVTDLSMPGMDGMELLSVLRSDPSTKELPVVILSGDVDSLRSRLADEPNLAFLSKPFEQDKLLSVISEILERNPETNR
ncbi:MAG TPA: response regulator [Fibrobacteria bacterium]|nr:response regulator [Fibrobacteria bacterium]